MSCMSRVIRVGAQHCGKPGRIDLLVDVAQALRAIVDMRALQLRAIEDVGAVDVFGVERRILAHQNHVEFAQLARRSPSPSENHVDGIVA